MNDADDLTDYASLALAGVMQAAELVAAAAYGQTEDPDAAAVMRRAIGTHRAQSLKEIFGPLNGYARGVANAVAALAGKPENPEALRYALQIIELAKLLRRSPQVVERLGQELDRLPPDPSDRELAGVYQTTISTLGKRIQVTGNPVLLKEQLTAEHIRTFLLAGIRFAWLWHQLGGRRWHLLVRRRQLLQALKEADTVLQSSIIH